MSVYGIASFADGFLKGRGLRLEEEDRKAQRARQAKLDELTFAEAGRAAELHAARLDEYDRSKTDWARGIAEQDKALAEEEARKAALAKAYEAAQTSYEEGQSQPAAPVAPNPAAVPGQPTVVLPPPRNHTADAFTGPGGMSLGAVGGGSGSDGSTSVATAEAGAVPPPPPAAQPIARGLKTLPNGYTVAPAPSAAIADELYQEGPAGVRYIPPAEQPKGSGVSPDMEEMRRQAAAAVAAKSVDPNYNHDFGNALGPDVAEMLKRGLRAGDNVTDQAVGYAGKIAGGAANMVNAAGNYAMGNSALPYFTGKGMEAVAPADYKRTVAGNAMADLSKADAEARAGQRTGTPEEQRAYMEARARGEFPAMGVAPPAKPAGAKPAPATVSPTDQLGPTRQKAELIGTAQEAMAEAATPAVKAAAAATEKTAPGVMGVKPGEKVAPEQRERAAGSFIDHYMKVGAPLVIEDMLKRGDYDGAIGFQSWMDGQEAKAGMKSWAKAAFAASVGDMDSFADEIANAYNRLGYFPDGTTIQKEESGFTYGKNGEITGAVLTFKDEATGNTFEQVFSDPNDLVRLGITLMAPENAYTAFVEQQKAASGGLTPKEAIDAQNDMQKRVDDAAKLIFEQSQGAALTGGVPLTYEQARAQAEAAIMGTGSAPAGMESGPVPVMRRPTN